MEFVHESVVKGSKIFQAFGTGLLEAFEEENLGARIDLFEEMAELCHGVAAGRDAKHIVHETFDELLGHVFGAEIPVW